MAAVAGAQDGLGPGVDPAAPVPGPVLARLAELEETVVAHFIGNMQSTGRWA